MAILFAQFLSEEESQDKVDAYSWLAIAPGAEEPAPICMIFKHPTQDIWFFDATSCIENGGLGREAIAEDVATLTDTFEINMMDDLYTLGYFPIQE